MKKFLYNLKKRLFPGRLFHKPWRCKDIGLIRGRHPLPVDEYFFDSSLEVFTKGEILERYGQSLREKIRNLKKNNYFEVNLYITGLTIACLVVVEMLRGEGITVHIYGYDPLAKYYYQGTF